MGGKSINLTSTYDVQFAPNLIDRHLPFFGRANIAPYGVGDGVLIFKGEPQQFIIKKGEKNYMDNAVVNDKNETYSLMLPVGFRGSALLRVNTNNRSPMSYSTYGNYVPETSTTYTSKTFVMGTVAFNPDEPSENQLLVKYQRFEGSI